MGFLRLLIIGALAYLGYRVIKLILSPQGRIEKRRDGGVIDEMVQDPQCKTYIPSRDAVKRIIRGKEYSFCSEECADAFEKEGGQ
jgi:YHS domain-containing protein